MVTYRSFFQEGRGSEDGGGGSEEDDNTALMTSATVIPVVRVSWLYDGISAHVGNPPIGSYKVGYLRVFDEQETEQSTTMRL